MLQLVQKSPYTKELRNADKKRDNLFRGLLTVVKGSLRQPDQDKAKAAERLAGVLEIYRKSIQQSSYSAESGALNNLLQDLNGPYAAEITLLNLTDWVTALEQAEQEFKHIFIARHEESVKKPHGELKKIRTQLDSIYLTGVNILDAQLFVDGLGGDTVLDDDDPDNGNEPEEPEETPGGPVEDSLNVNPAVATGNATYDFVVDWNDILKKYDNLLKQRAGRRAAKNQNGEDQNGEDQNGEDQNGEDEDEENNGNDDNDNIDDNDNDNIDNQPIED
ncbi:MAG: DUF6261 family protein [Tannerellaceae bacterium]|jgi:hypothetical protein|nr:DUF6261 family protein [Tannerellaceae bacterium]